MVCADILGMSTYEEMELLWDYSRNGVPFSLSLKHSVPFWWAGSCGHSWQATITSKKQFGCPVCAGKLIQLGVNDLASNYPDLVLEWHPTLNAISPYQVSKKTSKVFWWKCKKGHEWQAKVAHRANGSVCPYCSGSKPIPGVTDFKTLYPEISSKWHPTLNHKTPEEYSPGSAYKAWWQCKKGHAYHRLITDQVRFNAECYYCSGYKVLRGFNDLTTSYPELSKQWSPRNKLSPENFTHGSAYKAWWECEKGHEWEATIATRTSGRGCPVCSNTLVLNGFNDLATKNFFLAKEWHPTKNGNLTPSNVSPNSGKKVWWLGQDCGHEWEATIANRANGAGCFICKYKKGATTKSTPKIGITDLLSQNPSVAAQWHPTKNAFGPEEVNAGSRKYAWWQCEKEHEWKTRIVYRTNKDATGCPVCASKNFSSKAEKTIYEFIKNLLPRTQANVRNILPTNQELDIFVPEKNIAIEFNGVYWHDENHKPKTYHYDKWLACKNEGIQLIQVWEDEWNRNPEQIKNMLAHKLGISGKPKISGKKTKIIELTTRQTSVFLSENHIQGYVAGSVRIGLVERDNIDNVIAVMVLKSEPGSDGKVLNLLRFATSATVQGGFMKLLKYVERTYKSDSIITFSDNCVSDGGLYRNNGFIADKQIPPDYMYVVKGERKHKFGYRLKRFRNDPELKFEEGLTEKELARLNNIPRIWDAGKTRWVRYSF